MLLLDSWSDYRAVKTLVQETFDLRMLESVNALRNSVQVGARWRTAAGHAA